MTPSEAVIADQKSRLNRAAQSDNGQKYVAVSPLEGQPLEGGIPQARKRGLSVLTPTLGRATVEWFDCLRKLVYPMNWANGWVPTRDFGGAQVGEMRNRLVQMALVGAEAMGADIPYLFWLDDDVIVHPMAIIALMGRGRDVASGVYFTKGPLGEPLMFPGGSAGTLPFKPARSYDDPDATVEAYGWAQGLCLIKTDVYRRMRDELDLGVDRFGNPRWYAQPDFARDHQTGGYVTGGTEDFLFFENASKLGYRPVIDQSRFAFGFHMDMASLNAYPLKQYVQYAKMQEIVWPETPDHPEVIWPWQ